MAQIIIFFLLQYRLDRYAEISIICFSDRLNSCLPHFFIFFFHFIFVLNYNNAKYGGHIGIIMIMWNILLNVIVWSLCGIRKYRPDYVSAPTTAYTAYR